MTAIRRLQDLRDSGTHRSEAQQTDSNGHQACATDPDPRNQPDEANAEA